jgi:hypothetical protein
LTLVQIGLGVGTWVLKYGWPSWFADHAFAAAFTVQANSFGQAMVTTLHVAVGALILSTAVVAAMRCWLFFRFAEVTGIRTSLHAPACGSRDASNRRTGRRTGGTRRGGEFATRIFTRGILSASSASLRGIKQHWVE